ncbi:hypothetical protein H3H37_16575 [Duganella sp. LX20W]|uniref:Uncharacterized protein n=1 Tax=Rugamonas brunnea TaxID=2758569 RepID=A0A7W2EU63_9BURK|nr:hypothetical protein [Rugamonas brunnea]
MHGVARGQGEDRTGAGPDARASIIPPAALPVVAPQREAVQGADARRDDDGAPFDVPPLPAERLAQLRGGTDTVWNDMKLNGTVAGNTAVNVATGANIITNGSFSNASGLPVAIQNSGANVLIQNATIINVQLQ